MAPDPHELLQLLIESRLRGLSPASRAVIARLIADRGALASADALARAVGLRHRHQLRYVLARDGLPGGRTLSAWIRALLWTLEHEVSGGSMAQAALSEGSDPALRYRLLKRLTGQEWRTVRVRGFGWLLEQFLERYGTSSAAIAEAWRRDVG